MGGHYPLTAFCSIDVNILSVSVSLNGGELRTVRCVLVPERIGVIDTSRILLRMVVLACRNLETVFASPGFLFVLGFFSLWGE